MRIGNSFKTLRFIQSEIDGSAGSLRYKSLRPGRYQR